MSSLVQAKCVNSSTRASSASLAKRRFRTYSTALTSWLVVRSTSLTFGAEWGRVWGVLCVLCVDRVY
jgi:hypothetical protein